MNYLDVAEAKDLPGLRLVLTAFVPGPWGESAKKILEYKKIPYVPVAQYAARANEDLVAWTGVRNAPNAMYNSEPPRTGWYEILMLAERLAPERPLLPAPSQERALVLGISAEICSEWGWGWARRAMMGTAYAGTPDPARVAALSKPPWAPEDSARMRASYSVSVGGPTEAPARCADILRMLATRLHCQKAEGSPYLVGRSISAADIYWTVFSMALEPLPHELNPMPDWMRLSYEMIGPVLEPLKDPILLAHRDLIYERHLSLPLDF
jgi:glutathione S-transferase